MHPYSHFRLSTYESYLQQYKLSSLDRIKNEEYQTIEQFWER